MSIYVLIVALTVSIDSFFCGLSLVKNKKIALSVEMTSSEGDQVSFEEEGKKQLCKELEEVEGVEDNADDGEKCKLIIAKHRNGSLGTIPLKWYGQYTRFEEPKANRLSEAPVHNVSNDTTELIPVANDDIDSSF